MRALLLNFDADFTDAEGNSVTTYGSPAISSAHPGFGAGCAQLSASNYISYPAAVGEFATATAWTVDFNLYRPSGGGGALFGRRNTGVFCPYRFVVNSTGTVSALYSHTNTSWDDYTFTTAGAIPSEEIVHVAFVCQYYDFSWVVRVAINGVFDSNVLYVNSGFTASAAPFFIGKDPDVSGELFFDEFRVLHGEAAWTDTFTPPAVSYSTIFGEIDGAVELGGELVGVQTALGACSGPLILAGGLDALHPPRVAFAGAIEFAGAAQGLHPPFAVMSGALTISGVLNSSAPPFAALTGELLLTGELAAWQPTFAMISAPLRLSGALVAGTGPLSAISGGITFGGSLLVGRGASTQATGSVSLSGAASGLHGQGGGIIGAIELNGALDALFRQAYVGDCYGSIDLSGGVFGDYILHPRGEQPDTITVVNREHRVTVYAR